MNTITAIAQAIAQFFGFQSKRLDANNTEPMRKAQTAQKEVDAVSAAERAVKDKNTDEMEREAAE